MCDENTVRDMLERGRGSGSLTRRRFGALSLGAGVAVLLPGAAHADEVVEERVSVPTPDGMADCYFARPARGVHPAVLVWPDARGLRPAFEQMGRRLAESGYAVLVVNPYYRIKKAPALPEGADFSDEQTRATIFSMMGTLTAATQATDARAFIAYLDAQPSVDKDRKMGTTGYCMGGAMTMRAAAARPDRVGAGASFHGGRLVTDADDSPHLLVPEIKARYLFAIAENDDEREPHAKNVLRDAFGAAGLSAEIEVYEGALHGWCPPDSHVYNEPQAERAWGRLLVLFEAALA